MRGFAWSRSTRFHLTHLEDRLTSTFLAATVEVFIKALIGWFHWNLLFTLKIPKLILCIRQILRYEFLYSQTIKLVKVQAISAKTSSNRSTAVFFYIYIYIYIYIIKTPQLSEQAKLSTHEVATTISQAQSKINQTLICYRTNKHLVGYTELRKTSKMVGWLGV